MIHNVFLLFNSIDELNKICILRNDKQAILPIEDCLLVDWAVVLYFSDCTLTGCYRVCLAHDLA